MYDCYGNFALNLHTPKAKCKKTKKGKMPVESAWQYERCSFCAVIAVDVNLSDKFMKD